MIMNFVMSLIPKNMFAKLALNNGRSYEDIYYVLSHCEIDGDEKKGVIKYDGKRIGAYNGIRGQLDDKAFDAILASLPKIETTEPYVLAYADDRDE